MRINEILKQFSTEMLVELKKEIELEIMTREGIGKKINYDELSTRAQKLLYLNNIKTFEQLSEITIKEFWRLKPAGRKTYVEIERLMREYNVKFRD